MGCAPSPRWSTQKLGINMWQSHIDQKEKNDVDLNLTKLGLSGTKTDSRWVKSFKSSKVIQNKQSSGNLHQGMALGFTV